MITMLVRDPVHGDLSLTPLEAAVLDLPEVQRLRGIKQLGTASYVYPGALHTRFDHSLGASALAHRIIAALRRDGVAVADDVAELVAVGTLLHDVTHVPFGHTLEDERRLFPRHDKGTRLGAPARRRPRRRARSPRRPRPDRRPARRGRQSAAGVDGATSSPAPSTPTSSTTCAATPTSPAWRTTTTIASSATSRSPTGASRSAW